MRLEDVDVVLVRPERPGNVAATCRALKNMGLARLRLVSPCADPREARELAWGAWDVLEAATRAADLREATAACDWVVGTSVRERRGTLTPRELASAAAARADGEKLAVVLGPERTGLTREERRSCHAVVRIPTAVAQPSLNLAQAALLIAYELRLALAPAPPAAAQERATAGELEQALAELQPGLVGVGFLNQDDPGAILAELRRLLARASPTPREVTLLRGLARQLCWAGRQIGRRGS